MPRCGATFNENSVPSWTRGDFRGVGRLQTTEARSQLLVQEATIQGNCSGLPQDVQRRTFRIVRSSGL